MNHLVKVTIIGYVDDTYYNPKLDSLGSLNFKSVPDHFVKQDPKTVDLGANAIERVKEFKIPVFEFKIVPKGGWFSRKILGRRKLTWTVAETVKVTMVRTVSKGIFYVRETRDEINAMMKGEGK